MKAPNATGVSSSTGVSLSKIAQASHWEDVVLRKIVIDNFKSLVNMTYEPGHLNLVIGENSSGKTNLCQAIRFLGYSSRMPFLEAMMDVAGTYTNLGNVYAKKSTIDFLCAFDFAAARPPLHFEYSLSVEVPTLRSYLTKEVRVRSERLGVQSGAGIPEVLLVNESGQARLLDEERLPPPDKSSQQPYVEMEIEASRSALSQTYPSSKHKRLQLFQFFLRSWRYYDLDLGLLRKSEFKPLESELRSDGANLVSVLHTLKNTDGFNFRKLIELTQTVEPRLADLNFYPPHQPVTMYMEDTKGEKFELANVSNGTLRFLALCYVMLTRSQRILDLPLPPPLTIIEEPENGIYVAHFKRLLELIEPSTGEVQYIFTSHSPYFIDLFDAYLENVVVMKRGETHSELIRPDQEKIRRYLSEKEFPLGELHFRDMIA